MASDIDLLVGYKGPESANGYQGVRQAMPLKQLELHLYTADEVLERLAVPAHPKATTSTR